MAVHFDQSPSSDPIKYVPIANLILHFSHAWQFFSRAHQVHVGVATHQVDITDFTVLNSLDRFDIQRKVSTEESDSDLESLLVC